MLITKLLLLLLLLIYYERQATMLHNNRYRIRTKLIMIDMHRLNINENYTER